MNIEIILNKEEVLKLCEKDKEFEVCIQQAALNYLRNSKLKPLMKEEVVQEIQEYQKTLKSHVAKVLTEMGVIGGPSWNENYILLDDRIKTRIKHEVKTIMSEIISKEINDNLKELYDEHITYISEQQKVIRRRCNDELTSDKIKGSIKEVLEQKLSLLK